jgi:Phage integrase family
MAIGLGGGSGLPGWPAPREGSCRSARRQSPWISNRPVSISLARRSRHNSGYKLANDGQDTRAIQHYLGHRSIASTVRYTALAPDRFKGFWKDWGGSLARLLAGAVSGSLSLWTHSRPL